MEQTKDEQPPPRRGCFFYGCLGGLVIFLVIATAIALGFYQARRMIQQFTDDAPLALPKSTLTREQEEEVQTRLSQFQQAIRQHQITGPLVLSGDEINALIATLPAAKAVRDKIHIQIEGDQLKSQVSIKLKELGLPIFRERYLNAAAALDVSVADGVLRVSPRNITVKGKSLPGVYLDKIRKQNLAKDVNEEPRASLALERIARVEVKDGKLLVVPKPP